jgi:hypothetical protein
MSHGETFYTIFDLHAAGPLYVAAYRYTFSDRQSLQFLFLPGLSCSLNNVLKRMVWE